MALFDLHRPDGRAYSVAGRTKHSIAAAVATFKDWNDLRRTRTALTKLSNHELDDLGLTRSDIEGLRRR